MGKAKVISRTESSIRIIGDNILYNNGIITAYYILPLINYSVTSDAGKIYAIQKMTNLLTMLCSQRPESVFTIQRFDKVIKRKDVIDNLYQTIKLYAPSYDMPVEFTANIGDSVQEYAMLGINIQANELNSVEELTLKDTAKGLLKDFSDKLLNFGGKAIDEEAILQSEENIFSIVRAQCVRASRELTFYNYISKMFPCYEISYDKLSFVNENNFSRILGTVHQSIEDNFGYFVMHNEGVDIFELEPQDTYGCIVRIAGFPLRIDSANFSMDYPNTQVNIKAMAKEKAAIHLKRARSSDKYEMDEALKAGAESEQLEATMDAIDIATQAIAEVEAGVQMCEFNIVRLVTGITKEDLKQNLQEFLTDLKDRDILPQKSLNQALDFIDGYVKLFPRRYDHFTSLQFPLSFNLNSGALVGDADSGYFVPAIGEDLM